MKEKGKSLLQHYSLGLSSSAVFLYIEILYYTIGPKVQFFAPFRIFSELNNVSDFDPEMYLLLLLVIARQLYVGSTLVNSGKLANATIPIFCAIFFIYLRVL